MASNEKKRVKGKGRARRGRKATARSRYAAGRSPVPSNSPLIEETLEFWQPRAKRTLTREDAREIIQNVAGFFSILQEWEAKERELAAADPALDTSRTASSTSESDSSAT